MPQAKNALTTVTILDAITPNRKPFNVIRNPAPVPAESPTLAAINRAALQLAAKGPLFPDVPVEPRNPFATAWGKIMDQPAYTAWELARRRELCTDAVNLLQEQKG